MSVFKNSSMTVFTSEGQWELPCEVRLGNSSIAVSYRDDGELVLYDGPEIEAGHFKLQTKAASGRATLHRFSDDDILEGYWIEDGYEGMWRIQIDD